MTVTILKSNHPKLPPRIIKYRCYKNFQYDLFHERMDKIMANESLDFSAKLENVSQEINHQAPFKSKTLRGNDSSFMNKELRKEIMLRSKLKNAFLKKRSSENEKKYKKQRNHCLKLIRISKRNFFERIDE